MGTGVKYSRKVGIRPLDLHKFLLGGSSRDPTFWSIVLGDVPSYWYDPGQVPPQGVPLARNNVANEVQVGQVDISVTVKVYEGSGYVGGGYVCPPPPEYLFPVHFHTADTGAIYGGGETSRGAGVNNMVGTGRNVTRA